MCMPMTGGVLNHVAWNAVAANHCAGNSQCGFTQGQMVRADSY